MKKCKFCGKKLVMRDNESKWNFEKRFLCNTYCSVEYRKKNKIGFYGYDLQ